jgi:hypothetical protein
MCNFLNILFHFSCLYSFVFAPQYVAVIGEHCNLVCHQLHTWYISGADSQVFLSYFYVLQPQTSMCDSLYYLSEICFKKIVFYSSAIEWEWYVCWNL